MRMTPKTKRICVGVICGILIASSVIGAAIPAFASEIEKISSVRVKLYKDWFDEYGFPVLYGEVTSDNYSVNDIYRKEYEDDWDDDEDPNYMCDEDHPLSSEVYVAELEASEGYNFRGLEKEDVSFRNLDVTVSKIRTANSSTELTVEFKLKNPGELVGNLDEYGVQYSNGVLTWNKAYMADNYEIKVSGTKSLTISNIEGTSYDISSILTKSGDYRVRVYPVAKLGAKGDEAETTVYVTEEMAQANINKYNNMNDGSAPNRTEFITGWIGSDGNWKWRNADGTFLQTQWLFVNNQWYYFGSNGICLQNCWVESKSKWYYMGADGAMLTSTVTPDGYSVGADGVWIQ